jgi:threonine dehydrogenase-like Zn-dependent dehydrogenase
MTHTEDVFPFDWGMMYSKLPTMIVTNSAVSGDRVDCVKTGVELVAQGRLDPAYLITHRLSWRDVNDAFDLYSSKRDSSLKVLMQVD